MTVAFFGSYDPAYPRVRVFREALEAHGVAIRDVRVSPRTPPGLRGLDLAAAWLSRGSGTDAVIVPAFGHRDVPLAALLGRISGVPVLFDPLVSRWDTQVGDLGRVRAGSLSAARLRWSDRASLRLADFVLCDTWEHADFFGAKFGVARRKMARVPVGADQATFDRGSNRRRSSRSGPLRVVYVGGFLPLHGMPTIVRSAARIEAAHGPDFACFTLLGGGMLAHETARDAAALGLRSVRLAGRVPYDEAMETLAGADVALGIFGSTEKAGRVVPHKVFQALALGVPTVTRRSAAIAELFHDREHLLLVDPADPGALSRAIESLAADPEGSARLGAAGREAALESGRPSRIGSLLLEAIGRAREKTAPRVRR